MPKRKRRRSSGPISNARNLAKMVAQVRKGKGKGYQRPGEKDGRPTRGDRDNLPTRPRSGTKATGMGGKRKPYSPLAAAFNATLYNGSGNSVADLHAGNSYAPVTGTTKRKRKRR